MSPHHNFLFSTPQAANMCTVSATTFRSEHIITKITDCSPASRNSSKHTISTENVTSTQLCTDCCPKPSQSRSLDKRVTCKLKLARQSISNKVGRKAVLVLYSMALPKNRLIGLEQKLNGEAIGQAHSVTQEGLAYALSNLDVLKMIKKEQGKNRQQYAQSLTGGLSNDSSSNESKSHYSIPVSSRPSRLSTAGRQDVAFSGKGGFDQAAPDYRNTLPSQRPIYGKLALKQKRITDVLKIGLSLPPSTDTNLEFINQPASRVQEQAQELYIQDTTPATSFFTIPDFPGSLLEISSKARWTRRKQAQPIELAAPLSGSRARNSNSKVSQQAQPNEIPAPLPYSRSKSPRSSVVSQCSNIPLILKPGYLEPDHATRLKPFAIPGIIVTPPASPQEKFTGRLGEHYTPILNSKREKDYKTMNSTRSSTEIVRNHKGNLIPRYADQELPIVSIQSTSRKQRHSAKRTSPPRAELPNSKTLFEFAKEYSARGKIKSNVMDHEQDYAHYAGYSSATWNEVEVNEVDDESLSHRGSWSSVGSFEERVATKLPLVELVHGPVVVKVGAPSNRSLEQLGHPFALRWDG